MKVFVYGTLKRGYYNNDILRNALLIGTAVTVETFGMTTCGFPFMLREQFDAHPVVGELYDIGDDAETLARLDQLEGEGSMYDRVAGWVTCHGERHRASYYVACGGVGHRATRVKPNQRGLLEWQGERWRWLEDDEPEQEVG